ncbi:MAG: Holliday junction resolvase [Candidatus Thermoplasmatota archaeon]
MKRILEGEKETISKVTKTCSTVEKSNYSKIMNEPFAVVRAAGSLGVDLVAVRGDISFLTEVKSRNGKTIHFSSMGGKLQQQAEQMKTVCEKTKTLPVYAYRLKGLRGDSWRFFTIDLNHLKGIANILHRRLPKLETSKSGNFVMRWNKGMPLSDFISYLCKK